MSATVSHAEQRLYECMCFCVSVCLCLNEELCSCGFTAARTFPVHDFTASEKGTDTFCVLVSPSHHGQGGPASGS